MRLIVVDDDRLVVDSLKIILGAQPQIEIVGTGANGNEAVSLYAEHAPDIALLDILDDHLERLAPCTHRARVACCAQSRSRDDFRNRIPSVYVPPARRA